jgi:hypothetical protein
MGHSMTYLLPEDGWGLGRPAFGLAYATGVSFTAAVTSTGWTLFGWGLLAVLFLATLNLLTAWLALDRPERKVFLWEREIITRFLPLLTIPVAAVADLTVYAAVSISPHRFPLLESGQLFFGLTTEAWLVFAHGAQVLTNISERSGRTWVAPALRIGIRDAMLFLAGLRLYNRQRYRETHGGKDPPRERWEDQEPDEVAARKLVDATHEAVTGQPPRRRKP